MTVSQAERPTVARLESFHRRLYGLILVVAGAMVVLMMVHVCAEVFSRNFVKHQLFATIETVSNYYMVAITYLCISLAQISGEHIEMSLIMSTRSERTQKVAMILGAVLTVIVYGGMAFVSAADAVSKTHIGTYVPVGTSQFSIWPAFWLLPIGFALMAIVTITTTIVRWQMGVEPEPTLRGID